MQNNNIEALKIQDSIISEKDSVIEILNAENKQFALTQYKNMKLRQNVKQSNFTPLTIIVLLAGMGVFAAFNFRKKKHNLEDEIANRDKEILTLKQNLQSLQTLETTKEQEIWSLKQTLQTLETAKSKTNTFVTTGEKLYNHVISNHSIGTWSTADMVNFVEYYRTLNPDFVTMLETEYQKLTPRYKIILILENMGKSMTNIMEIMSIEETSFRSAKSRINSSKKIVANP